ncbi:MAG TPA: hypothetical protein VK186_00480 [Candidatus Deferrimicrobium sp.]|nr:hypothetical protein [Candidatus Kapabacteria bacterium]HLP57266.1 hypothetical protein [Candidatus Deferrimicrobium sp.]
MNLKKSSYFKPLCLLVAVLFTTQCVSIERKLVSTEEKVIENTSPAYVYELEKIKKPSVQDPIVEYRIVKFPADRVEINTYQKIRKINRTTFIFGILGGALIGGFLSSNSKSRYVMAEPFDTATHCLIGAFIGGAGGLIGSMSGRKVGEKEGVIGEIKVPIKNLKKADSTCMPSSYLPLEFKWGIRGKSHAFKTKTDEQGIVRINLLDDLKITKFPLDHPLVLYIYYLNPESQIKGILRDSLGSGNNL